MGSFLTAIKNPFGSGAMMILASLATIAAVNRIPAMGPVKRVVHSRA
jgi:hypothetical protein